MPTCSYKHNCSSILCLIQCFSIKQAAVWLNTSSITRLLCGSLLFHRLALKEDDAFNRLPVQPSFYHHPGFLLTFYEQSSNSDVFRQSKGAGLLYGRQHPTWRQSLTCLRCAQRQCVCGTAFISTDVISDCDDTQFHSSVPEIVFWVEGFPV